MTRRERLERKAERREQWASSQAARSQRELDKAHNTLSAIPSGQPILVDHHSASRHRGDIARADSAMRRCCEASSKAAEHERKAEGIRAALDRSIFTDDTDAAEALRSRIAEREAQRDRRKAANKAYKNGGWDAVALVLPPDELEDAKTTLRVQPYYGKPFPPYSLTNLGALIRADKKRLEEVEKMAQRTREAEEAGGVVVKVVNDWSRVTFAEKPAREVINALKAAGFRWASGSWHGPAAAIESLGL